MGRAFLTDQAVLTRTRTEAGKCPFPVSYLQVTCCQELYEKLSRAGQDRPATGLQFNVAYIDTKPNASNDVPVVVCIHGAPGGHWDFNDIIINLSSQGARVIAINFPGYDWTQMDDKSKFKNSSDERAVFIRDFLKELGVTKVTMGIAHSAGTFPAFLLSSEPINLFDSLFLINPAGLEYLKSLPSHRYAKFHSRFYRIPFLRFFLLVYMKIGLLAVKHGNTDAYQMSVALETMTDIPFQQFKEIAGSIANQKFPIGLIFSKNDRAVEFSVSEKLVQTLKGTEETLSKYNIDGECTDTMKKGDNYIQQHLFEGGGHFVMKKYPERVNEIISKFFERVLEKSKKKHRI